MVRQRPGSISAAVCTAGAMSISPLLLVERHDIIAVNKSANAPSAQYDVIGNLPAPFDLVALRQELPVLSPGDVLAVMDVGAYFSSLGNNFSGPRPPVLLIDKEKHAVIRERETFEDMVSRDICDFQHPPI